MGRGLGKHQTELKDIISRMPLLLWLQSRSRSFGERISSMSVSRLAVALVVAVVVGAVVVAVVIAVVVAVVVLVVVLSSPSSGCSFTLVGTGAREVNCNTFDGMLGRSLKSWKLIRTTASRV